MSLIKVNNKVLIQKCSHVVKSRRCVSTSHKFKDNQKKNDIYDTLFHPTLKYREIFENIRIRSKNSALLVVKTKPNSNQESLYENVYEFCTNLSNVESLSRMSKSENESQQFIVEFSNENGAKQLSQLSTGGDLRLRMAQLSPKKFGLDVMQTKKGSSEKENHSKDNLYEKLMHAENMSEQMDIYYTHKRLSSTRIESNFLLASLLEDFFVHYMEPGYSAYLYGSAMMGVATEQSDVDICLTRQYISSNTKHRITNIKNLTQDAISQYKSLHNSGTIALFTEACSKLNKHLSFVKNLDLINAKVPILSFHFPLFETNVDISLDNSEAFQTAMCFNLLCRMDSRVAPYLFLIKQWSKQHNLVGGGFHDQDEMTNFMVLNLGLFYLMRRNPKVICNVNDITRSSLVGDWIVGGFRAQLKDSPLDIDTTGYDTTTSSEELFLEFLEYYRIFDFKRCCPSLNLGEAVVNNKRDFLSLKLSLCSNDVGKITKLKSTKKFSEAAERQLRIIDGVRRKTKNSKPWGILKCIKVSK